MLIILDASVVIKWFKSSQEENREKALVYKNQQKTGEIQIHIPALFYFELFHILLLKDKNIAPLDILEIKKMLSRLNLVEDALSNDDILFAARLVRKYQITFYDASYVALAKKLGGDLITADKKLVQAINLPFVKEL